MDDGNRPDGEQGPGDPDEVIPIFAPQAGGLTEPPPRPDAPPEPEPEPERVAAGATVTIERATPGRYEELLALDWLRSLHPAMAGPVARSASAPLDTAFLVRDLGSGAVVGVLDAIEVPGYQGVINVSVYTDTNRAKGGLAIEAYALFVPWLFDNGARMVHHEVLELNKPIQRVMRAIGIGPTARYREHAYAAGRYWDVLVYSYDRAQFDHVLEHVVPRAGEHVRRSRAGLEG